MNTLSIAWCRVQYALLFVALTLFHFAAAGPARADDSETTPPPVGAAPGKGAQGPAKNAAAPAASAKAPSPASPSAAEPKEPATMVLSVQLEKISEFKLDTGTFVAEFFLETICDRPCKPDIDIINGEVVGKPDLKAQYKTDEGAEVRIFKYKARVHAIVNLREYPYDKHTLPIILGERGLNDAIDMVVDVEGSKVDETVEIPGWDVKRGVVMEIVEEFHGEKSSQMLFSLEISRPSVASTFKSMVPVIALIFVAAFALILKPKSAQARLNAATAGLVPVVMFQVGQVSSLPPIGYLTRMDKFMIATYIVYLVHIAFSVMMVRADEKKNEKGAELAYFIAAGAVPGVGLVAWLTVFLKLV